MGKIGFTPLQNNIFSTFSREKIASQFYFTGGTALSVFYLNHRESEDLDFFSEKDFDPDEINRLIRSFTEKNMFRFRFTKRANVRIYEILKGNQLILKVDFNYYPYKRIEKSKKRENNLDIDSLRDIAVNKLLTINQREDVKDFVDLYYLLERYTIWDLIYGVEAKFGMEMDMFLIASDFLKIEEFDFLPKMLKPLKISDLVSFYKAKALEIGKKITK